LLRPRLSSGRCRFYKTFKWPLPLLDAHYQLSYLIAHDEQPKPIGEMRQMLEEMA